MPTSLSWDCTTVDISLHGLPKVTRERTRRWPPLARMPSLPAVHPAVSRICFAFAGSNANAFSRSSRRPHTPSPRGPTQTLCTPKKSLSTIDLRSTAQFKASRTARSSVGGLVTLIVNPTPSPRRGERTNAKRLSFLSRS